MDPRRSFHPSPDGQIAASLDGAVRFRPYEGRMAARALVLALVASTGAGWAAPVSAPHVQVELLADARSVQPGRTVGVGVRFSPDPGWHVYWRNPGDSGEPPSIAWTVPPRFDVGDLE